MFRFKYQTILVLVALNFSLPAFATEASAAITTTKAAKTSKINASSVSASIQTGVFVTANNCESNSPCSAVYDTSKKVLDAINKGDATNATINLIYSIAIPQFDFTLMTRFALGNNWKLATQDQQQQLVLLFKELLIYAYSSAITKFKGSQITITNSTLINEKRSAVTTLFVLPNSSSNEPIKVEYDLAKPSDATTWKVYDIKIENTSLVTTYRNQFNDVIQSSKIEGLIKQLKTKV
ncbi:MAG: ABC transporter substrate-binding protein, partial [Burkholderiales bacterium]|nr:ABC transporter substrate-binding protein [Burkholderiales bacterium]